MPLRLVHFADLHLGVETYGRFDPATGLNTRLLDFTRRFDEVVEYAVDERVDLVLFAGDAYRSRDPSPTQQREFALRIRRLSEAGIPVFLLVGNHDLPAASGRANSLDIYETLGVPNVTIGRVPKLHRIETRSGPIQIMALPWLRRSALFATQQYRAMSADEIRRAIQERAADAVEAAVSELDSSVPAVLAGHISVEGATYGSERSVLVGEDIVLPRSSLARPEFAYIALGHIHKHQVLDGGAPLVYPGSLERVDFGEEHDPKGFMSVTIDGQRVRHEFRPVAARPFRTIRSHPAGEWPTQEVIQDVETADVSDSIVRLIVETTPDVDARIDYTAVRRSLGRAYCIAAVRRDIQRLERRLTQVAGVESLSEIEALELYLKLKEFEAGRRQRLLEYARPLIGAAE